MFCWWGHPKYNQNTVIQGSIQTVLCVAPSNNGEFHTQSFLSIRKSYGEIQYIQGDEYHDEDEMIAKF